MAEGLTCSLIGLLPIYCIPLRTSVSLSPDAFHAASHPSPQELIDQLVQYDCPVGMYNQVASLLFVNSNTAIK